MSTLIEFLPGLGIVAALLLSYFANVNARKARELASERFRNLALSNRITKMEADHAVLCDSVDATVASMRKLRGRDNARRAREKNSEPTNGEMTDQEWLDDMNKKLSIGGANYGGTK